MLAKKMIRDIKNHKIQFISIFLMAFLGIYVFVGFGAESFGFVETAGEYYNETNFADGWIYASNLNGDFQDDVNSLSLTKDSERQLVVNSIADFDNDPDITLHFLEDDDISKFYLVKGSEFNLSDGEGVWLDTRFADAKNLTVGDNITFEFNGIEVEKEIKGLGYSPEHLYQTSDSSMIPDYNKMGFAYMSYKAFPMGEVPYNVLLVKYDGNSSAYEKQLDNDLDRDYSSFLPRAQHPSFAEFQDETEQHQMMTDVIPLIFIIISMLTLLTTMTRIINSQRTQIGVLKALGFKNRTIMFHYISYGFWMVLAGTILGFILGPLTLPQIMFDEMSSLYSIPNWIVGFDMSFIIVSVLMVGLSAVISYLACRNIVNESPSSAIRPKVPKITTTGFIERFSFWKKSSFNVRWNYRDAKRNKFRSLMSIVGVLACTLIIVASFGCMDGFDEMKEWSYEDINHYSSKLVLEENATESQIDNIVEEVDGERFMESSIEIKANDIKKSGVITVLDDNELYTPTDDNKNPINISDNEISISKKMAQLLDVKVGDTVKWHIMDSDKWVSTKIDNIHSDPTSQGIILTKEKLEDLGLNYTETSIISSQEVKDNFTGVKTVFSMDSLTDSWDEMMESSMSIIYLLAAFAAILSVIVLYNLGLLSFTEIKREFATLKVLGFKSSHLRKLLLTQNLWFTTIGFLIGVPLGRETLQYLWGTMGDSFYLKATISIKTLVITFLITYVVSILVNLMFSGKIKKLNMVESLKDNE
ncbi:MAG: ABC transporter permease [Methanobrevibacter sp.]|jgi:putative ABC transport system permease protein|uniref:ABC transporter permease n=1 Tax=Methanobrevibacter sp. TaxID=66852 RepID=UPI0025D9EE9D|nr:ABC transporter permease [Methanobrevibacter sp.]MBE6497645.1 ABC transporter permease [Methanobrevibacter sp.]